MILKEEVPTLMNGDITLTKKLREVSKMSIEITPSYIKSLINLRLDVDSICDRTSEIPFPYYRNVYFRLCKDFCSRTSLENIGKECNNRDHSTVLHGLKRFEEFKEQLFFKPYYQLYMELFRFILKEKIKLKNSDLNKMVTLDEVKQHYKFNFLKLLEKYRYIVNKQQKKLQNLCHRPLFEELSELDDEQYQIFEDRFKAFLTMNKN